MAWFNFVTGDWRIRLQIDRVQVQAFWARDQRQSLFQIGPQLFGVACFARVVAGGLNAAGQGAFRIFEPGHVISLPAVHRHWQGFHCANRGFNVHANGSKALFCQFPSLIDRAFHMQSSLGN
ncbi:hypothetical protein D3C78_1502530 [compost metagenome]